MVINNEPITIKNHVELYSLQHEFGFPLNCSRKCQRLNLFNKRNCKQQSLNLIWQIHVYYDIIQVARVVLGIISS